MTVAETSFAIYGLALQALLVGYFSARRRKPSVAMPLGTLAYALGLLGLPLGLWLAWAGQASTLVVGPLLTAGWALLGWVVDLWRPRPWRGPPVDWRVLVPYVAIYLFAQLWMWWPLWDVARVAWAAFGVLFAVNTALNIRGHVQAGAAR